MTLGRIEKVYILVLYEYDTFSYSGISESQAFVHKTLEGAEAHAKALKLEIVKYCDNPNKQATIDAEYLLD